MLCHHFLVGIAGFLVYTYYPCFHGKTLIYSLQKNSLREQLETQRNKAGDTLIIYFTNVTSIY